MELSNRILLSSGTRQNVTAFEQRFLTEVDVSLQSHELIHQDFSERSAVFSCASVANFHSSNCVGPSACRDKFWLVRCRRLSELNQRRKSFGMDMEGILLAIFITILAR